MKLLRDWQRERKRQKNYEKLLRDNEDVLYSPAEDALRLYVVVRDDVLPPLNQGIQAAHAIVELSRHYDASSSSNGIHKSSPDWYRWKDRDKTLILLGGKADDIKRLERKAKKQQKAYATFYEPDLDLITALAVQPMTKVEGDIFFRKFRRAS